MNKQKIEKIVKEYYPIISKTYSNCKPKVEIHFNIYERLSEIKGMSGSSCAQAEYDWSKNTIYLYTSRLFDEEDVIKALIHECVHSTQCEDIFNEYYKLGYSYATHPHEVEARNAEKDWKHIYWKELDEWMCQLGDKNGRTNY